MQMTFDEAHPLQPFWQLAAAPIQAQALELALSNGLFEALVQHASVDEVARRYTWHPANTAVWLELLWSMGSLSRSRPGGGRATIYRASSMARRFFVSASDEDCAQAWLFRLRFLRGFAAQMDEFVRSGEAGGAASGAESVAAGWAQAAQAQIAQEQRAVTVPAALAVLRDLPGLGEAGRFLDLGGGPGLVAIALARAYPGWRGMVCDLPETVAVAQRNIEAAALSSRLDTLGADLDRDAIGDGYDLIWCSSVLHFVQDPAAALRTMYAALNPGGRLVLAHAERGDDARSASRVLPFYTPMRMRGRHVPEQGEIARVMAEAGFGSVDALGCVGFPMSPVWVYVGAR
jgi:SAM-dependent methyltransferase